MVLAWGADVWPELQAKRGPKSYEAEKARRRAERWAERDEAARRWAWDWLARADEALVEEWFPNSEDDSGSNGAPLSALHSPVDEVHYPKRGPGPDPDCGS